VTGRIPRSRLSGVAAFLEAWLDQDDEVSLKLVGREPENHLESFLVDTTRVTSFLLDLAATVHASGTLAPLEEYHASLGLPAGTTHHVAPSPWGPQGLTLLATRGLTTRYESLKQDPRLVDRLQDAVRRLVTRTPVKTAVFFPSHDLHQQFLEVGVFAGLPLPAVHETRGMPQDELVSMIAGHRARAGPSLITGVLGGRLSEGIDYPGQDLEAVIIVGTPYPKPTAHQRALFQWAERSTGNGWEFTVTAPALRRLRQAIGRIRRGPADQGLVVLVDERSAPLLRRAGMTVDTVEPEAAVDMLASWAPDDTLKSDATLER
jgi:DNA excision repair protein ERCC-2